MGRLTRFCAQLTRVDSIAYTFRRTDNGELFTIAIAEIHKKVCFPFQICENNRLKSGCTIDFVEKTNEKTGRTNYYPDTATYKQKTPKAREISSDEYAAHLLNLIDHANELDIATERNIVHAISHNNANLACNLIRMALFKK